MSEIPGYNERIFSKGVRSRLHHARFYWLYDRVKSLFNGPVSVLELGCFDAKTISFLPYLPAKYAGYDANWENGLDIARRKFSNPDYKFYECSRPEEMNRAGETFDLLICMETLEHIPDEMLEGYLQKLKAAAKDALIVTVPNETGLVFLGKYLIKLLIFREGMSPSYTFADVVNQTLGRMERVIHDDHKGFDYRRLINRLRQDWDVTTVSPIPFNWLPLSLGFSVGMVCRRKDKYSAAVPTVK
jgi:SAM-dependent methyltransferase